MEEAASKIVALLKDPDMGREMGVKGREAVRRQFLLSRYLEQHLDLFSSFETVFKLNVRKRGGH